MSLLWFHWVCLKTMLMMQQICYTITREDVKNSMVSLKNLIDNGDTLECDYFPENDMNNKCHLVIDKKLKKSSL